VPLQNKSPFPVHSGPLEREDAANALLSNPMDSNTALDAKKTFLRKAEKATAKSGGKGKLTPMERKSNTVLKRSLNAYRRHEYKRSVGFALEATQINDKSAQGYHVLAMALEKIGETHKALLMYEKSLALDPTEPDVYLNLGAAAWNLNMLEGAEKFFRLYIQMSPASQSGYINLGCVLRDQCKFDDAIEVVRGAILLLPEVPELWNAMGSITMEAGDLDSAYQFYAEAIRLDPDYARAWYNWGYACAQSGDDEKAIEYTEKSLTLMDPKSPDRIEAQHSLGMSKLSLGQVAEGWSDMQIRHHPQFRNSVFYGFGCPHWSGEPIEGKRIVVMAEQGIGDEVLFANPLADLIKSVGPEGQVYLCVEERLVPVFRRSYPKAEVGPYSQGASNGKSVRIAEWIEAQETLDFFAAMGDLCLHLRPSVQSFKLKAPHLKADPELVADWTLQLEGLSDKPKVGLCWKSGLITGSRIKHFCPIQEWGPILTRRDVTFINLQYEGFADDIQIAKDMFDCDILTLDELDLKRDIENNMALCSALDLVISAPTAAAAFAGGIGTKTWVPVLHKTWTLLGENHYPWYTDTSTFIPTTQGDWPDAIDQLSQALEEFVKER
jgi:tetratricopeptide (TPR) repeat protein